MWSQSRWINVVFYFNNKILLLKGKKMTGLMRKFNVFNPPSLPHGGEGLEGCSRLPYEKEVGAHRSFFGLGV